MKIKQYSLGNVTYGYSLQTKKWEFKCGENYTFLCNCKGTTSKMRESISKLVAAGFVRSNGNGIDGLARANINNILAKVAAH
jgi:hypothetical protein